MISIQSVMFPLVQISTVMKTEQTVQLQWNDMYNTVNWTRTVVCACAIMFFIDSLCYLDSASMA